MEGVWIKVEELEKLKQQIAELEAERDLHKRSCERLITSNKDLNSFLVASRAREQVLRDALVELRRDIAHMSKGHYLNLQDVLLEVTTAIDTTSDDTALRQHVRKEQAKLLRELADNHGCIPDEVLYRKANILEDGK